MQTEKKIPKRNKNFLNKLCESLLFPALLTKTKLSTQDTIDRFKIRTVRKIEKRFCVQSLTFGRDALAIRAH